MIDIGINIANEAYEHDRDQVISRAQAAGIDFLILTGSCMNSNEFVINYAKTNPNFMACTAGFHPHHADTVTKSMLQTLETQLQEDIVKAVGETGLDFFRNIADPRKQEQVFEAHLELAVKTQKPLFLHQRDSHERFLPIVKHYADHLSRVVVHCFTDQKKALFDYLDLDFHIGITGWVADERRGTHLLPLLESIPKNRLMVETDGPYLLPRNIKPRPKSRRNEPCFLPYVISHIAKTLNLEPELVADFTSHTAQRFFQINQ